MHSMRSALLVFTLLIGMPSLGHAEFIISSAILEFNKGGAHQQDIELISRSSANDYIESEINEVVNPGLENESRRVVEDPATSGLLVTPDKTILTGGGRKILRFVLLKEPDDKEHIYRVAVKPVIKGMENTSQVGLKVLVGYEVLVIVRPADPKPSYTAKREGKTFTVVNTGNTNILFQSGKQCPEEEKCKMPNVVRAYPGQTAHIDLPLDKAVSYAVWDGKKTSEQHFD